MCNLWSCFVFKGRRNVVNSVVVCFLVDVHDYLCVICGHVLSRLLSHFVLCGVLNPLSAGHLVSPVIYPSW